MLVKSDFLMKKEDLGAQSIHRTKHTAREKKNPENGKVEMEKGKICFTNNFVKVK